MTVKRYRVELAGDEQGLSASIARVDVIVGDPVDLSAYRGKPIDQQVLVEATELLMRHITALLEELVPVLAGLPVFLPARQPLLAALTKLAQSTLVGDGLDAATQMGPINNLMQLR